MARLLPLPLMTTQVTLSGVTGSTQDPDSLSPRRRPAQSKLYRRKATNANKQDKRLLDVVQ